MSQLDTIRALDADLHAAFAGAGFAFDSGVYRAPGIVPPTPGTTCRGYVDLGTQVLGEFGQIIGRRDEITFLLPDVTPANKGTVEVDGVRYMLTDKVSDDEGQSRWVVRRV